MSALSIIPGGRDDVTGPSSVEVAGDCCRPRDTSVHPSLPNVEATLLATCSTPACGRPQAVRGLCKMHYQRAWRDKHTWTRAYVPPRNPANPWAGRVECPQCHSSEWTMPFDPTNPTTSWRCVACHIWATGPHAGE